MAAICKLLGATVTRALVADDPAYGHDLAVGQPQTLQIFAAPDDGAAACAGHHAAFRHGVSQVRGHS